MVAANYQDAQRALAFGIIGGVAAGGAAAGPLIGGAVTSIATWRLVFSGESVIVRDGLTSAGLEEATVVEVVDEYEEAQIVGLRIAFLTAAGLALLGLLFTRRLPTELLGKESAPPGKARNLLRRRPSGVEAEPG